MGDNFVVGIIYNSALLLALSVIYEIGYILPESFRRHRQWINGLLIGAAGVVIMSVPVTVFIEFGIVFDTRSVLLFTAGLAYGPIPAVIAAGICAVFRITGEAGGMLTGVAVIITSTASGLLARRWVFRKTGVPRYAAIYAASLGNHLIMLLCFLLIPMPLAAEILRSISLPILTVYPVATVLLSMVIIHQQERSEAHIRIEESETRFRHLVESTPDGILIAVNQVITFVNPAMLDIYAAADPDQLVGRSVLDLFHPDGIDQILEKIENEYNEGRIMIAHDEEHRRLDGQKIYVNVTAVPLQIDGQPGSLVFVRDFSGKHRLEQEKASIESVLQHQQKLESIGTLAGGVAHEINNPINGIMNYAQLILDDVEAGSDAARFASDIIHESDRISTIVKNLLQFSRQDKVSHSIAAISDIVSQTISLIRTIIRKDQIELEIRLDDGLPDIRCRSQQIQQVLMNLLTNARDALNEKYPGYDQDKVITIEGHAIETDGRRWIRLTVTDRGLGIRPEIADRIFDPFYSTKAKEEGTGLGLAISFGIVKDHQGRLTFESEPDEYTSFHLDLPADND